MTLLWIVLAAIALTLPAALFWVARAVVALAITKWILEALVEGDAPDAAPASARWANNGATPPRPKLQPAGATWGTVGRD